MDQRSRGLIRGLGLGSLTIGTDFTGAMMLAVPIEREYGVDITTTQWVVNVYALTFSMALVAGGRLADLYGRRRLLRIGLAIFVLASLGCTLAPTISWLIGARALQGIGSAIVWPAILGIVSNAVEEDERGFAIGLMIGAIGIGNSIGPIAAGVLSGIGEWRMFFGINVLLGALTLAGTFRLVPADRDRAADERIDTLGMAVLSLAILALLYALDVGADWGWGSLAILGLFAGAAVLFTLFPVIEARVRDPLMPPSMLRNGQFMIALAMNGLAVPGFFVFWIYLPQYFQNVLGWSVLEASLSIIPSMICIAVTSPIAGRLYDRIGPRSLLLFGYGLLTGALVVTVLVTGDTKTTYIELLPSILLVGIGSAVAVSASGPAAVAAVDPSRASLAGGLSFMVHLALGALGVAGATAILFGVSTARLSGALEHLGISLSPSAQLALAGSARGTPEAKQALRGIDAEKATEITAAAQNAFVAGFDWAICFCVAVTTSGIILALFIRKPQAPEPSA
ncbi:MAG: MFS transporter [Pseudomonadota bacterium]